MSNHAYLLSKILSWTAVLSILAIPPSHASLQGLMDEAKAVMPETTKDLIKDRVWNRVAYTEALFEDRTYNYTDKPRDPPIVVPISVSPPGLIWVIFYSSPPFSASAIHVGGGEDWSPARMGDNIWSFRKPESSDQTGLPGGEGIFTFIFRIHNNLEYFEAGIRVASEERGAAGGAQRGGFHTLEILFSPDGAVPPIPTHETPITINLIGHWITIMEYQGKSYTHDMYINSQQDNGTITGSGGYPAGSLYTFAWQITSGSITKNGVNFVAEYIFGAVGTIMNMNTAIVQDHSLSGTWSDNLNGEERTGTWSALRASDTNNDPSKSCVATYSTDNKLRIPYVTVPDAFGKTVMYEASLQLVPDSDPLLFELVDAKPK